MCKYLGMDAEFMLALLLRSPAYSRPTQQCLIVSSSHTEQHHHGSREGRHQWVSAKGPAGHPLQPRASGWAAFLLASCCLPAPLMSLLLLACLPAFLPLAHSCGRIGRLAFRVAFERKEEFQIVHLNDLAAAESTAYLIQFDSVHGKWLHSLGPW